MHICWRLGFWSIFFILSWLLQRKKKRFIPVNYIFRMAWQITPDLGCYALYKRFRFRVRPKSSDDWLLICPSYQNRWWLPNLGSDFIAVPATYYHHLQRWMSCSSSLCHLPLDNAKGASHGWTDQWDSNSNVNQGNSILIILRQFFN